MLFCIFCTIISFSLNKVYLFFSLNLVLHKKDHNFSQEATASGVHQGNASASGRQIVRHVDHC